MLKNIFLIALLASAVFTQDAVVTHYDLDGNVIAEEVQAVNEEVVSPMMGESSENEMADKTQLHSSPLNEISDAPQEKQNQQSNDSTLDDGFDAPMMETDSLSASQDANDQLIQSDVNLESEAQTEIKQQVDEQLNTQPDEWTSQVTSSNDITGIDSEKQIDDSLNQAQEGTTNAWVQSETDINAQQLIDGQLNSELQGSTSAWGESNIIDTTKLAEDSLQSTEGKDAWVQSEANLEAEAEKAKKTQKKPEADSTLDEQDNAAQPNIAENVAKNADIKEGEDDVDSPHSDRDKDKPHPGAETEAVNQEVKNEDGHEPEEGQELNANAAVKNEDGHEPEEQELQSTEQSQKNLVQGSCIIIYAQCQFKGEQMEVCQSLSEIEKFQHDIMSIYIPKGLGLTVYDSENFEGKSHKYTTSQNCLKKVPKNFPTTISGESDILKKQMSQSETIIALKQQNYEQAKQIEQLLSRMNLVMKQQRNQTSQASQQKRLEYAYSKKKMHDDLKEELERQRSLIIDPTPLLRNKNYMMKNQIKESLKRSMESVKYLKKKEAHNVKALSEKFEARIDYQQNEDLSAKRNKKNEVKIREYESKKKYQMYWKERENKFKEEQQMMKESITKGLEKQKDFLKILEEQEMRQLQELQQSEQQNQNMRQQIKDAQTLSVKEYEQKYGKPKESKFKKIMDIKANS